MIQNWCLSAKLMELNTEMESLELKEETSREPNTVEEEDQSNVSLRRSSRIRGKPPILSSEPNTRQKRPNGDGNKGLNKIEKYYLSKQVKRLPSTLETIYEEPKSSKNEVHYMSTRKFKRVLDFEGENSGVHKHKRSKKRLMKAKKVTVNNRINAKRKISMEAFLHKLETIEENEKDVNH